VLVAATVAFNYLAPVLLDYQSKDKNMRPLISIFTAALFLASAAYAGAAERAVTLKVDGMTCPSCPYMVKKSLTKVKGVNTVKVSLEQGKAWVVFDDAKTTVADLTTATGDIGFPSQPIE